MGKPKHGKDSARSKSCAKYKSEGRRAINKQRKADRIAAGKKICSRKKEITQLMKWDNFYRSLSTNKPYVDSSGAVYWGVDEKSGKGGKKKINKKNINKDKSGQSDNKFSVQTTTDV